MDMHGIAYIMLCEKCVCSRVRCSVNTLLKNFALVGSQKQHLHQLVECYQWFEDSYL